MKLIKPSELAEQLQVCEATIHRWSRDGKLPFSPVGRQRWYNLKLVIRTLTKPAKPKTKMKRRQGDMWEDVQADAVCVTTNGIVGKGGRAIMGAGVALQARKRYRNLPRVLGSRLSCYGNHVFLLRKREGEPCIVSLPTKEHWKDPSSLELIDRSCRQLRNMTDDKGWKRVCVPRPGCNNGGLDWKDVRPILRRYFDSRFVVYYL